MWGKLVLHSAAGGLDSPSSEPLVLTLEPLQDKSSVDDIIDRLLDVRTGRPGKQVNLTEQEIKQLCNQSREIFSSQPNLLELEAPIKICGGFSSCPRSYSLMRAPVADSGAGR